MHLRLLSIPFLLTLLLLSCGNSNVEIFDNQTINENKFQIPEIREIYQLQNDKKTQELEVFLKHSNPLCRETSALAFASLQDTAALENLLGLLENDKSTRVRMAAAFAIGQTKDTIAEDRLKKISGNEKSLLVKDLIFEAIGKCGTIKGHDWLVETIGNKKDTSNLKGILLGLSRFSIRGIATEEGIKNIVEIIQDKNQTNETRLYASIYLIRIKGFDLSKYVNQLTDGFNSTSNIYTKMNIVNAMSKAVNKESYEFLINLLLTDCDYRLKVNAIKSLAIFQYYDINKQIFKLLNDSNISIAIQASEYFLTSGIRQDATIYFAEAKKIKNWRVRTNMLKVALRLSPQKSEISKYVITEYKKSTNLYEKGSLLRALGGDFNSFEFIKNEVFQSKEIQISTAGTEALADMRRAEGFNLFRNKQLMIGKTDLEVEFAQVFKDAITSGDVARVGIAAEIIRDTSLGFRQQYENSFFLTQALNACKLPAEIETYRELQQTIAYINGSGYVEETPTPNYKIDWNYVAKIPIDQKVEINTSKGIIELVLYVNQAPMSVSNFLKLSSEGYFNNKLIHRVVPNFVVQDGCPRGDGWGSPDYTIWSEFAMNYFTEGSLGMASSGKDTEGSQWFITHSPTPHLDGRYTNFGKVIKGMQVVHCLEVGDTIFQIEAKPPIK